ncbi:MAG: nucleotidyl transferase AbiEii/AbiGii toxin family protein [Planctomycetota bacterium]|jgi:predicted nucleotidyltransferase component of viral defense system
MDAEQRLLAVIMNLIAERFDQHAVLRGGMVLRLLGSRRFTNDLDYVFVPYASKKDIVEQLLECLGMVDNATLTHSLNSKCLRVIIKTPDATVQVEAKVAKAVNSVVGSTRTVASEFNLPPRLLPVLDYEEALAHKMAAWNERRLVRDVYDIWFFLNMGILPDREILTARLTKPTYSKLVTKKDYFQGDSAEVFFEFLKDWVLALTQTDIETELKPLLPREELPGLLMQFKASLAKLH